MQRAVHSAAHSEAQRAAHSTAHNAEDSAAHSVVNSKVKDADFLNGDRFMYLYMVMYM